MRIAPAQRPTRPRLERLECRTTPASSWVPLFSGTSADLHDVTAVSGGVIAVFPGPIAGIVGDGGTILRLTDNHETNWQPQDSGTAQDLYGIGRGFNRYAVGANGTILYNGGYSWQQIASGTTAMLRAVAGIRSDRV